MNHYEILQIPFSKIPLDEVNRLGHTEAARVFPAYRAHLNCSLFGSRGFTSDSLQHYEVVATIDAKNLEEVFEIGNGYGDQARLTRKGRMHSLSVGDLVRCDKTIWMCDPIGWQLLDV